MRPKPVARSKRTFRRSFEPVIRLSARSKNLTAIPSTSQDNSYTTAAVAKLGLKPSTTLVRRTRGRQTFGQKGVDRLGHGRSRPVAPAIRDQMLHVTLIGDIAQLDQYRGHIGSLQNPEARRFQGTLVHPRGVLHFAHQHSGESV